MTTLYTAMGELRISSHDLLERFGITVGVQRPVDALGKLEEEVREVRVEILSAEHARAVDESVDVLVTLMNLWRALGATDAELITAMRRVAQKNDAKTSETHECDPIRNTVKRKVGK